MAVGSGILPDPPHPGSDSSLLTRWRACGDPDEDADLLESSQPGPEPVAVPSTAMVPLFSWSQESSYRAWTSHSSLRAVAALQADRWGSAGISTSHPDGMLPLHGGPKPRSTGPADTMPPSEEAGPTLPEVGTASKTARSTGRPVLRVHGRTPCWTRAAGVLIPPSCAMAATAASARYPLPADVRQQQIRRPVTLIAYVSSSAQRRHTAPAIAQFQAPAGSIQHPYSTLG